MKPLIILTVLFGANACTLPPKTGAPLPLMSGYRTTADWCVRLGENAVTNPYLDDSSDLVGCPIGYDDTGNFIAQTGAVLVGQAQGYALYSVRRR